MQPRLSASWSFCKGTLRDRYETLLAAQQGAAAGRLLAISTLAGLSLILAGVVNLVAGFMGLFPGLFEASAANAQPEGAGSVGLLALLGTPYGRYAIAHLAGAGVQLAGGSWFEWLTRSPFIHAVAALCVVSLGLEVWGWVMKGALSFLSVPGLVAAILTAIVYSQLLRAKAAP